MTTCTSKPFHEILATLIESSPLTQREIALRLGYRHANILSMFKAGVTPVPITKLAPIAEVLGVDPVWLLRLAISEYEPGLWDVLTVTIGFPVTNNEIGIVKGLRIATAGTNPRLSDPGQQLKLEEFGQTLLN